VDVTDVLRDRMQEPAGLQNMMMVSIAAHAAAFAALLLAPGVWLASQGGDVPETVMTISLGGGGEGPRSGGMTMMGGRPVQVEAPPPPRPEPVRPPAAAAPEMTVPVPTARPVRPSAPVKQAPDEARGRTPTKGERVEAGSAVAVTGARGEGFGLSTGGGPGVGAQLDVGNFCCPDYLVTMISRIRANWTERQNIAGLATIRFTIRRDGAIQNVVLERSSTFPIADLAAQRAVVLTRQLPPLPEGFPNPTLTVHLNFQYER
jgi:TonB family protein